LNFRSLRFGAAALLFGFLLVFFVPMVYDSTMFQCSGPGFVCLTNQAGLKSIGYTLFHWGAAFSFGGAGDPQLSGYSFLPDGYFAMPDGGSLTAFGVLMLLALPVAVADIGLIAPELARKSRATRIGLAAFGAFILSLSILMFVSVASEGPNLEMLALAGFLGFVGANMVFYGPIWIDPSYENLA
jgi:hypothetical protein